jgi:hypothetical protein
MLLKKCVKNHHICMYVQTNHDPIFYHKENYTSDQFEMRLLLLCNQCRFAAIFQDDDNNVKRMHYFIGTI